MPWQRARAMFVKSLVWDPVLVKPAMLGSNIREVVLHLLRTQYEGVCTRHGYVLPGSVAVHRILPGRVESTSLNGDTRFDVQYAVSLCNPAVGAVVEARVVDSNQFGVLLHSGVEREDGSFLPVIEAIVTKQDIAGIPEDKDKDKDAERVDLDKLEPGQTVSVMVMGKKFELGDRKISVIGRVVAGNGAGAGAGSGSAAVATSNVLSDMVHDAATPAAEQQHEWSDVEDDEDGPETPDASDDDESSASGEVDRAGDQSDDGSVKKITVTVPDAQAAQDDDETFDEDENVVDDEDADDSDRDHDGDELAE